MAGLLELAAHSVWLAAGVGFVLGLLSAASGGRVQCLTYGVGLREDPPARPLFWLAIAAGAAVLSAALAWWGGLATRPAALGAVWGWLAMDLGSNARALGMLRNLIDDQRGLALWLALPLPARYAVVTSSGVTVATVLALAYLASPSLGLLGFVLGVWLHLAWQRYLTGQAAARAAAPPAEPSA